MSEKEWTPGPHKAVVGEYSTAKVYGPYRGKPGQILCEIVGDSPEADANAYLFAAAEALYAALEETLEIAARHESGDYIERANAAMRKARGE